MSAIELADLRQQTIQELPDAKKDLGAQQLLDFFVAQRGPLLESWGSRSREEDLRRFYRYDYNWMIQGAFAGVMKVVASAPWEIKGPDDLGATDEKYYREACKAAGFGTTRSERPDVDYWQTLLRQADFGRGWGSFFMKGVDYLRQDGGWYWEIIAPGSPLKAPTGPATGLAHLDSLRCLPTGDPEFPVVYIDKHQKLHRMHYTRVRQLVDMPDGDERHPGYGLCALSRAIAIAHREVYMGRYVQGMLDDLPPPGIVTAIGITREKRNQALELYREEQSTDQMPPWGKQIWLFGMDRDSKPEIETTAFQQAPEKFDFKAYTELDVDALALALGVDRQELWQLTSGNIGSGAQSEILQQKARGKVIGILFTTIERNLNDILPEEFEFSFKVRDSQEDQERAQTAKVWVDAVAAATPHLDDDEARQILADKVEAFGEALRDDDGTVRERDDLDVLAPGQGQGNVTRPDNTQTTGAANAGPTAANGSGRSNTGTNVGRREHADTVYESAKQFQATRLNFEAAFSDLVSGAVKGDVGRVRFRVVARALLRTHGRDAYLDGLREGGVQAATLEDEDQTTYTLWLVKQNSYVSELEGRIYRTKIKVNPDSTADMWANKSLQEAYYDGLNSASRNGMFEFVGQDGKESCTTCKRLKGQRHRMKDWTRKHLRPGVDIGYFKCGGWHCNHTLAPSALKAWGSW